MSELVWWPRKGYGFQEGSFDYGHSYWAEFLEKDRSAVGRVINALRCNLVQKYAQGTGDLVDVGIGGGGFIQAATDPDGQISVEMKGFDVNPHAVDWLGEKGILWDEKDEPWSMSFWDSIEHIYDPSELIDKAAVLVFISTPIYESAEHVIHSKHYKPGEHLWYFSDRGLKLFMAELGFYLIEQNRMEESAGRDGIGTYVFHRAG